MSSISADADSTGRAFDPKHYPWEGPEVSSSAAPTLTAPSSSAAQPPTETAAGHTEDQPRDRTVVTAAAGKLAPAEAAVKPVVKTTRESRPPIDYAALRRQVTMEQALAHLNLLARLKGTSRQLRGACPIHDPQSADASSSGERCFSVALDKQVFRCFAADCSARRTASG